jgi:hypothetical protein
MRARADMQVPRPIAKPSERGANGGEGMVQRRPNDRLLPIGFVEILLARTTAGAITESKIGGYEFVVLHCPSPSSDHRTGDAHDRRIAIRAGTPVTGSDDKTELERR